MTGRYRTLEVTRHGPVGWLVFDRPDVGNAVDATMFDELPDAWAELDGDPDVRVIVNTGNGPAFQTGLDLAQLAGDPAALRVQARQTRDADLRLTARHNRVAKPVIAAVNGTCAGGGLHFVADADVVIAAADARFVDPHVSVGQVSAFEAIGLVRRMPAETVFRMVLAGRYGTLDAARGPPARPRRPGRRPPFPAPGRGRGRRRTDRPHATGRPGDDQAGRVGRH